MKPVELVSETAWGQSELHSLPKSKMPPSEKIRNLDYLLILFNVNFRPELCHESRIWLNGRADRANHCQGGFHSDSVLQHAHCDHHLDLGVVNCPSYEEIVPLP